MPEVDHAGAGSHDRCRVRDRRTGGCPEEVGRSYLGLTLEQAEDKAAQEDRTVRVTTQDGVELGGTDDLQPGRLSLTICNGIVVDTQMDLEPAR